MVEMLAAMQSYAAHMRDHVPGVMAITAGVDAKDPSLVHDLQGSCMTRALYKISYRVVHLLT